MWRLGVRRGAGDDFAVGAFDLPLHVGDFFGPLVDQQYDDIDIRVVLQDRLGHLLQQDRFTGLWGGDDQRPLAKSDRGDHIDDAGAQLGGSVVSLIRCVGCSGVRSSNGT